MNKEQLKILINDYLKEIDDTDSVMCKSDFGYRYLDILTNARNLLPDNAVYLHSLVSIYTDKSNEYYAHYSLTCSHIKNSLLYVIKLLSVSYPEVIEIKKILEDAQDKLKEAGISFEKEDYPSVISKINTGVELALKDELDIPMTIKKINTRKIIDLCIANNIGPKEYLQELIKHVLDVDNQIKHQGFKPGKIDCVNAISAFEGFIKMVKKYHFEVTDEIRKKIFSGV